MNDLPLKDSHPIPFEVLETDIAILGQKGGGKSYATKGLVERLLTRGRRVGIIDPLHHWFGLKAKADGSPGFPIVVIGGPKADIPLDIVGGGLLGRVLAETKESFIVDVSDLTKSQLITFATAFLTSLYKHNREALWLVAEEADIMAPQNPAMDGSRAMLDAMDQIARRGRQRGFRLWSITQRPARLNKDVLSMASSLILMRIRGPQDRSAAEDWIKGHATKAETKQLVDGLAALEIGQGYVYAPDVEMVEKVRFPMISTLDTSSTPKAGDAPREVREFASVDVEALRKALEPPARPLDWNVQIITGATRKTSVQELADAKRRGHEEGYKAGHAAASREAATVYLAEIERVAERLRAPIQ